MFFKHNLCLKSTVSTDSRSTSVTMNMNSDAQQLQQRTKSHPTGPSTLDLPPHLSLFVLLQSLTMNWVICIEAKCMLALPLISPCHEPAETEWLQTPPPQSSPVDAGVVVVGAQKLWRHELGLRRIIEQKRLAKCGDGGNPKWAERQKEPGWLQRAQWSRQQGRLVRLRQGRCDNN